MDIELLKTFLEVNKTRHFGRAADNLYLTPAAVSARVRQLEQILGAELFIRTRNNIQLTLEGERLVPHAETMLLSWSRAVQDVVLKEDQQTQLTLGTTSNIWQFGLKQQAERLFDGLPNTAVRLLSHPAETLVRMLREHALDVAILMEPPALADYSAVKVGQIKLMLVSSCESANTRSAVQQGYVLVDWGISFSVFHAKRFGDLPRPAFHTNMGGVALDYVCADDEQKGRAAYLPHSVLERLTTGLYQVAGTPSFVRPLYAVYRSSAPDAEVIESALTAIKPLLI